AGGTGRAGVAAAPGAGATGCSRVAPVRSASGAGFAQTTSRTSADGGADAGVQRGGRHPRAANAAASQRLRHLAWKGLGRSHSLHVISQTLLKF
ncbi:unnamed protein product, partial [Gulo gulo]